MKIALVCPSNTLYMPYVENYINILNEIDLEYDIINWDRFKIEKESRFIYRDSKIGHQRSFLDYFKYSRFLLNILKDKKYDNVIIFGIQLVFFLEGYLIKNYGNKYIIDIRDHNRVIKYFNIEKVINKSMYTVLSSPGYKEWLPKSNKYVINHNTKIGSLNELKNIETFELSIYNKISVGCIGALRDYKINIDFIEALKNIQAINLNYHGEGDINKDISKYLIEHGIENVSLTGRYNKEEEPELYKKNNIINVLRYNDGINNKTALPNRLYSAAVYGKPMLGFEGTYLAEIIKEYNLGLIIDNFDNIEKELVAYFKNIDFELYKNKRYLFFDKVIKENIEFENKIKAIFL